MFGEPSRLSRAQHELGLGWQGKGIGCSGFKARLCPRRRRAAMYQMR